MKRKGFTLIELLIVVAIIAILAAIAVPNFLEAQTRSKVSRMKADMRTVATAIEAYTVDYNRPPFDWDPAANFPYYLHNGLSTPISYLTSARSIFDIFATGVQSPGQDRVRERLRYRAFSEEYLSGGTPGSPFQSLPGPDAPGMRVAQEVHGAWFLTSKGPDGFTTPLPAGFSDGRNPNDWLWLIYDPTNGTVSPGQIIRSQNSPEPSMGQYGRDVTYSPLLPQQGG